MAFRKKGLASYGEVNVTAGTAYASEVELIHMLFDGLIDSLALAEGQMARNEMVAKTESLNRSSKIIVGLKSSLDFEKGGEIATNLNDLYGYCLRRIMEANLHNDQDPVIEVKGLMTEIRDAWAQIPDLLSVKVANAG